MSHVALARILSAAAAALSACERPEQLALPASTASTADSPATPAMLRVSNVMIGRRIGSGNRVIEPTFEFAPSDTIHVSVATVGPVEGGAVTAAWRSQSGEILEQSSVPVRSGENTALQLFRREGLRPGTYKVVLFLGRDSVDTKVFLVRK